MNKLLSGLLLILLMSFPAAEKVIPNDPWFKLQYSFNNPGGKLVIDSYSYKPSAKEYDAVKGIDPDMTRAWAVTAGKKDVVVALLDDGFFYQHEDIKDNIWKNPGESGLDKNGYPKETNGIDDDGKNVDLKENFTYPVSFENENILTVAEIDFKGELYRYKIDDRVLGSSYGEKNVDISAIGMNFTTFLKNNRSVYALGGGTSNSTPVVTGVAALALSVCPELKALELKKILMDSVKPLPSLKGKIKSGGMVNA